MPDFKKMSIQMCIFIYIYDSKKIKYLHAIRTFDNNIFLILYHEFMQSYLMKKCFTILHNA